MKNSNWKIPKAFPAFMMMLAILCLLTESTLLAGSSPMGAGTQQERTITGLVTSAEDGLPLIGVAVVIKGTTTGVSTDQNGRYSITVSSTAQALVFSFLGMQTVEMPVLQRSVIDVAMQPEVTAMEAVVVTALGITREKKALGYSVQELTSESIERTKDNNVINTLQGKVAGLVIQPNASGPAGTTRVLLRGYNTLSGNNDPLYVIDGIPFDNTKFGESGMYGAIDQGDIMSTVNPADIESITVLKGPNAAALYGSRANNGVIVITTKSGKARKGIGVTASSSYTFDTPLIFPDFQNEYGQGSNGTLDVGTDGIMYTSKGMPFSWGPKMTGQDVRDWTGNVQPFEPQPDNMKDFYRTGHTSSSTLALVGGNDRLNSRASITYDDIAGIQPTNDISRYVFNLRTNAKLSDKLSIDAKTTYVKQAVTGRMQMADMQGNPGYALTLMPRNIRTVDAMNYMTTTGVENLWTSDTYKGNPYWTINMEGTEETMDRFTGLVAIQYDFTDWLKLQVRASQDEFARTYLYYRAKGTQVYPAGNITNGKYFNEEFNSDFLLTANKNISPDITSTVSIGGNLYDAKYSHILQSGSNFKVPDFYQISNSGNTPSTSAYESHKKTLSLYGLAQFVFKNYLFLDLTARNDWSSTLPAANNSYFYPSVTTSFIFTDAFREALSPTVISFGKVRASWAQVGADPSVYQTNLYYSLYTDTYNGLAVGTISSTTLPNYDIKPYITNSIELGTDLRFFKDRLGFDFTYYNKRTANQIMTASIPRSTGYFNKVINAGELANRGIEALLSANPIKTSRGFSWDVTINFAKNYSEVVELVEGIPTYLLGQDRNVTIYAKPGRPYGDIYVAKYLRDEDGNRIINTDGLPIADGGTSNYQLIGNFNPDWTGGISNTFSYKGLSFYSLIDVRKGGEFYSVGTRYMVIYGTTSETLEGREEWYAGTGGYVADGVKGELVDGVWVSTGEKNDIAVNPQTYWGTGGVGNIGEEFIQDGTFVKMREISLSYDMPKRLLAKTPFTNASVSLVGRNLFFLYRVSKHYDPESSYNSGNYGAGVENHAQPTTKSLGFSIKITL
jgi:TonB-linked SusC/RagA family outer membrane protein